MRLLQRSRIDVSARLAGIALITMGAVACGAPEPSAPPEAACGEVPADLAVPILTTASGAEPLHWPVAGGCIRVTYDPAVADHREDFTAALDAWQGIGCSSLCFEDPVASDDIPEAGSGIPTLHIGPAGTLTPDTPGTSGSVTNFVEATGQIRTAYIAIADPSIAPTPADWSHYVGFALGLDLTRPSEDGQPSADPVTPSAIDEESFCVLYGDPPLCTP